MKEFFIHIQRNEAKIIKVFGSESAFCASLRAEEIGDQLPTHVRKVWDVASPDDKDYAIACAYALLIGKDRRKELICRTGGKRRLSGMSRGGPNQRAIRNWSKTYATSALFSSAPPPLRA